MRDHHFKQEEYEMKKRLLTLALALVMALSLAACGGGGDSQTGGDSQPAGDTQPAGDSGDSGGSGASGTVYYLNFKPEQDPDWQELAKLYTQETGVEVKVQTAASGQYETQLMSEMAKTDAPTLFQVNGPVGLANWKDYCYDLSGSALAGELSSQDFALMDGDSMSGIAYVIETYGLIYNKALLEQAVFYQNGTWAFGDVADIGEENLGMLPIYIGVGDEAKQGLCTGTENYWCVNKNAKPEDIQATLDFMYWCVTSETGLEYLCSGDHMGFVIPFKGNLESSNLLVNIANDYVANGTTSIK